MHPKSIFQAAAIAGALFACITLSFSAPALAQDAGHTITAQPNPDGTFKIVIQNTRQGAPSVNTALPQQDLQNKKAPTTPVAATTQHSCPFPGTPSDAIFRDLKGVNFYLAIPPRFRAALECHGHETECAKQYSNHERYAQQLQDDYDAYPTPLRPEHLTQIFVKQIEQVVTPFVQPNEQCKAPEVQILDKTTLIRSVYQKDTLTVTVKLVVDGDGHPPTRPHLGVLSMHLFRPDCGHANYDVDVMGSGVMTGAAIVPLDLPDDELAKRLDDVVAHSQVSTVGTDEGISRIYKQ